MARKINPDKPLSKEDRQWLTDWGRIHQIKEHDLAHPPKGSKPKAEQSGDDASGEQEEEVNPTKGEPNSPGAQAPVVDPNDPDGDGQSELNGDDDEDDEDDGDWYEDEGVTNDHLKDELGKRELSKSGNKEELIARLREDDANEE